MFDNTDPTTIHLEEWPTWIKDKFNLVKFTTGRALPVLSEEYKFFEDLNIDLDTKFYII